MNELHGRPTAGELVESVREFLERDILTSTDGRTRFHTRVAINVLAMVERELAEGPQPSLDHAERLNSLGVSSDAELAQRLRSGDFDADLGAVAELLRASADARLAVANPQYSS